MVTSNTNKAREVAEFFGGSLDVCHVPLDIPELRSDDVAEISTTEGAICIRSSPHTTHRG